MSLVGVALIASYHSVWQIVLSFECNQGYCFVLCLFLYVCLSSDPLMISLYFLCHLNFACEIIFCLIRRTLLLLALREVCIFIYASIIRSLLLPHK